MKNIQRLDHILDLIDLLLRENEKTFSNDVFDKISAASNMLFEAKEDLTIEKLSK